ncbi:MAG TPA: Lrp/AsnC family transcriptional regulator, partial [Vicinamibacterales bacterium]|nr:Lrp/AsnC family transcriptional regulator [Vicinamibacterales bacterium]
RKDPQMPNTLLAKAANISELAVSNRIDRMVANRQMKVTVQRDIRTLGYTMMGLVDVFVSGAEVEEVGEALGRIPHVVSANLLADNPQIVLFVAGKDNAHFLRTVEKEIAVVHGVQKCVVSVCLEVVKYAPGLAAL